MKVVGGDARERDAGSNNAKRDMVWEMQNDTACYLRGISDKVQAHSGTPWV